jgi:hypothetical protein
MDIDLSPDALAAAFVVAKRDTMPALKQAGDQHGPTVLVATFVMLAETLAGFGATRQLARLVHRRARTNRLNEIAAQDARLADRSGFPLRVDLTGLPRRLGTAAICGHWRLPRSPLVGQTSTASLVKSTQRASRAISLKARAPWGKLEFQGSRDDRKTRIHTEFETVDFSGDVEGEPIAAAFGLMLDGDVDAQRLGAGGALSPQPVRAVLAPLG